jgi:hypothetical protein
MRFTIAYLRKALLQRSPIEELRVIVEGLLNRGYTKERILNEFERFRGQYQDDPYENILLDVMDFLTGWCGPHVRVVKSSLFTYSAVPTVLHISVSP